MTSKLVKERKIVNIKKKERVRDKNRLKLYKQLMNCCKRTLKSLPRLTSAPSLWHKRTRKHSLTSWDSSWESASQMLRRLEQFLGKLWYRARLMWHNLIKSSILNRYTNNNKHNIKISHAKFDLPLPFLNPENTSFWDLNGKIMR